MKRYTRNRRALKRPGVSFIETLVASLIVAGSLMGMVTLWQFSFKLTMTTNATGIGYTVGRRAIEEIQQQGFDYAADGSSTIYFDVSGGGRSTTQATSSAYKVTTTVTTSAYVGTTTTPATTALRTVSVTVVYLPTSSTVYSTGTYLVKGGV